MTVGSFAVLLSERVPIGSVLLAWLLTRCLVKLLQCLRVDKPRLRFSEMLVPVLGRCQVLMEGAQLTPWAGGFMQSVLFAYRSRACPSSKPAVAFHREVVKLSDGGQLALDWATLEGQTEDPPEAIVVLVPGVVGTSGNACYLRLARFVHAKTGGKWRCVTKAWRGLNCPLALDNPRSETWDQRAVLDLVECAEHLRKTHPQAKLLLYGSSQGGNVVVAALATERGAKAFSAGFTSSAPFDLEATMDWLEGDCRYPFAFVNTLVLSALYDEDEGKVRMASALEGAKRGFKDIDRQLSYWNLLLHLCTRRPYGSTWHRHVTCRFSGHDSVRAYYKACAAEAYKGIRSVRVPLLCLLSDDDPVAPPFTYQHVISGEESGKADLEPAPLSANVVLALTRGGGHCGWFQGLWADSNWSDEVAHEFFVACLKEHEHTEKNM